MQYAPFNMLPLVVQHDTRLSCGARLLFGDIYRYSRNGYCYASNAHFAKLYATSEKTIRRWVGELKTVGYVLFEMGAKFRHLTVNPKVFVQSSRSKLPNDGESLDVYDDINEFDEGGQKCPPQQNEGDKNDHLNLEGGQKCPPRGGQICPAEEDELEIDQVIRNIDTRARGANVSLNSPNDEQQELPDPAHEPRPEELNDKYHDQQAFLAEPEAKPKKRGRKRDEPKTPPGFRLECKHYGELKNVYLKDDELEKLYERYGKTAVDNKLEALSLYIPNNEKGRRYKNHYAALMSWFKHDAERQAQQKSESRFNLNEQPEYQNRRSLKDMPVEVV